MGWVVNDPEGASYEIDPVGVRWLAQYLIDHKIEELEGVQLSLEDATKMSGYFEALELVIGLARRMEEEEEELQQ